MTQVTEIIEHVDKQVKPWIEKLQSLDRAYNGNGDGEGMKTKVAVMEKDLETFKDSVNKALRAIEDNMNKRMDTLEAKFDVLYRALLIGGILVIVIQIVLSLFGV